MKYFVPAWSGNEKWWFHLPRPFYSKSKTIVFDDIMSLMSMHHQNKIDFKLLHLSYHPTIRSILHRHDLYELRMWSLFDEIQGFDQVCPRSFQLEDLEWPDDTEFIYSPYIIQAMTPHYTSKIYFNQVGYLIRMEDFENGQCVRAYIFDDRGYLSALRYYENGQASTQDYFTVTGQVVLRENLSSSQVTVMPAFEHLFNKTVYASMEELIKERFHQFCHRDMRQEDHVIVGSNAAYNEIFEGIQAYANVSYSIFSKRNVTLDEALMDSMAHSSKWLVDTNEMASRVKAWLKHQDDPPEMLRLTPFNTQKIVNISSQLNETYIGLWIDNLPCEVLTKVLQQMLVYIQPHASYRLVLITKKNQSGIASWLKQWVSENNESYRASVINEDEAKAELIYAKEPLQFEDVIQIQSVPFEDDLIKVLARLRVVMDLGDEPDLYLQIASISVRIPQIHAHPSAYISHQKNGYILSDGNMYEALDYFLTTLKHWNTAYTFNTKMIDDLSSYHIVQELNEFLEGDTDGKSF